MNPSVLLAIAALVPTTLGVVVAGIAVVRELQGPRTAKRYRPIPRPFGASRRV